MAPPRAGGAALALFGAVLVSSVTHASAAEAASQSAGGKRPNLVYILMDDTDVLLGGGAALKQARALLADAGADFTRFLTLSPKCTPSRTGQLAGRHYHNVRPAMPPHPTSGRGLNQTYVLDTLVASTLSLLANLSSTATNWARC